MIMKTFRAKVGVADLYTNMYVVADEKTKDGILIDAGGGIDKIIEYIDLMGIKLRYIVLTHCHADHIFGLKTLRKEYSSAVLEYGQFSDEASHGKYHAWHEDLYRASGKPDGAYGVSLFPNKDACVAGFCRRSGSYWTVLVPYGYSLQLSNLFFVFDGMRVFVSGTGRLPERLPGAGRDLPGTECV